MSEMEQVEKCSDCRFWRKGVHEEGTCHRLAPSPVSEVFPTILLALSCVAWNTAMSAAIVDEDRERDHEQIDGEGDRSRADWPTTSELDWCGQFEARRAS